MENTVLSTTFNVSFLICLACLIFLGFFAFRKEATLGQFFLENGKIKSQGLITGTLLATNLSLGNFIFILPVFGYYYGFGALWLVLVINLLAPLGFYLSSDKFKNFIEDSSNSGTVHQYIAEGSQAIAGSFNYKMIRLAASLATVCGLLLALLLELHFTALIFERIFDLNSFMVFSSIVVLICFYTAIGGFRAVLTTDRVQMLAQAVGTVVLICFMCWMLFFSNYSNNLSYHELQLAYGNTVVEHLSSPGWATTIGFMFVGFGWAIVGMDNWQRCCATRELNISLRSVVVGFIFVAILASLWVSLGIVIRICLDPSASVLGSEYVTGGNPVFNLFSLSTSVAFWGSVGLGLLAMSLVMAGLSTADTFLTVSAHSLVSDIFMASKGKDYSEINEAESQRMTWFARAVLLGVGLISLFLWAYTRESSLILNNASDLFFSAYSVQYALMAPILCIVFFRKKLASYSVVIGIMFSVATSLVISYLGLSALTNGQESLYGLYPADVLALAPLICTIVGVFVLVLTGLFCHKK